MMKGISTNAWAPEDFVAPPTVSIPRWAVLAGRGRCRVLRYEGNGYFTVLTNRDRQVFVHRDRLTFTR